jgi:hypothetical protein
MIVAFPSRTRNGTSSPPPFTSTAPYAPDHQGLGQPLFYQLIKALESTGHPVVVNTSFNVRGADHLHTAEAIRCFLDRPNVLAIGDFLLKKC